MLVRTAIIAEEALERNSEPADKMLLLVLGGKVEDKVG